MMGHWIDAGFLALWLDLSFWLAVSNRSFKQRKTMDKKLSLWTVFAIVALSLVIGCAKKSEVDTSKLESSFASAEPADKTEMDKAVSSIKAGDFSSGLASLQKLSSQAKLTPEQQQAVQDVIAQVQKQLGDLAQKAGDEAQKTLDAAKQALPKP
jgi:hypothetical protein